MGAGIAQVAASTGHKVTLVDISQQVLHLHLLLLLLHLLLQHLLLHLHLQVLDASNANIAKSIQRVAKKKFAEDPAAGAAFVEGSLANMHVATSVDTAIQVLDGNLNSMHQHQHRHHHCHQ